MAKFTMADLLNSQSKKMEERPAFEIRHIPIDKLKPSVKNQYGIRGIEELAANIEMLGLLHNLDVKEADEAGYYEIISGERRYQACKLLYESGNQEFKTLPCKVEALTENKAISELKLLYANAAARELTDYEKTYQAGRIKEILQALKKDGYKFQGRMREIVADMLEVSPAQMGRMESINKNLSPEFKEEFKAGNIGITTAYELSGQSEAEQAATLEAYKAEGVEALKKPKPPKPKPQPAAQPPKVTPTAPQPQPSGKPEQLEYKSHADALQALYSLADRLERQAPIGRGEMVRTIRAAARMLEKDENQVEWGEVSPEAERLYNNLKER